MQRSAEQDADMARLSCHASARHASECLVEDWLAFFGHRWNALILWHLSAGPKRFSDLMEALPGVTPKVLTERLAALAQRDIVARSTTQSFPRQTSYALTPSGHEVSLILRQLYDWAR